MDNERDSKSLKRMDNERDSKSLKRVPISLEHAKI